HLWPAQRTSRQHLLRLLLRAIRVVIKHYVVECCVSLPLSAPSGRAVLVSAAASSDPSHFQHRRIRGCGSLCRLRSNVQGFVKNTGSSYVTEYLIELGPVFWKRSVRCSLSLCSMP